MYKRLLVYLTGFILLCSIGDVIAKTDEEIKKKFLKTHVMSANSQGRKFIVGFPPNEKPIHPVDYLEIYVTSSVDTKVTLSNKLLGVEITKPVEALKITTFSSANGETSFAWELRQSESIEQYGFTLDSPDPISVYVLNAKPVTSEGYLAIPVSAWGTEYIHCSFYDFNEVRKWRSGFMVLGAYENTRVRIQLKGVGKGYAKTAAGKEIGESYNITLNEGEVFMVQGDGQTRGVFDLSGSSISSSQPVGLLSFHERTMIPAFEVYNGRDHLIEMMPPVSAWGTEYASVEYARNTDQGDFFRIIASEPNTNYHIKWYEAATGELISQRQGMLNQPGDFEEFIHEPVRCPHDLESIRGTSVFKFDKPTLVLQYDYSAEWDCSSGNYDPFMILVVPVEQFTKSTVFQTPDNKQFNENFFNIIAVGDTTDPARESLRSIKIDDVPIWNNFPTFLFNQIPGTNLFWAKVTVGVGAHKIQGDTKFGGYIYGFSSFDTYGWPAAMAIRKLDETDTLEPLITWDGECGEYTVNAWELRNGEEGDNPRQVDQGISDKPVLDTDVSYNFNDPELPPDWKGWPPSYQPEEYEFTLSVIDKYQDAFAKFYVFDRSELQNTGKDSIRYEADSLVLEPEIVDFDQVRVNLTKSLDVKLNSHSDSVITIKKLFLKRGAVFSISKGKVPPDVELMPRATHDVTIDYTPIQQYINIPEQEDWDSLIVETECLRWAFYIRGQGIEPIIWVDDWNAGLVKVNDVKQKTDGLEIRNLGTMELIIDDITGYTAPFGLINTDPPLPISIPPGTVEQPASVYLRMVEFAPTVSGSWTQNVKFHSNATVNQDGTTKKKDISVWTGRSNQPGIFITGYDWERRRVESDNDGVIYIRNNGDAAVLVAGVEFADPVNPANQNFEILYNQIKPFNNISETNPYRLDPEGSESTDTLITVPVRYKPLTEDAHIAPVRPILHSSETITNTAENDLRGIGFLPKILVEGYTWDDPWTVGMQHSEPGRMTITSTSESADLFVYKIRWTQNPGDIADFAPEDPMEILVNQTVSTDGAPLVFDVNFTPQAVGARKATFEVLGDYFTGNERENPDDFPSDSTGTFEGIGFDTGILVLGIDYGNIVKCDSPIDSVEIRNMGSDDLHINSVEFINGNWAYFNKIRPTEDVINNTILASGESLFIVYQFEPWKETSLPANSFSAVLNVNYRFGQDPESTNKIESATIEGEYRTSTVSFSMPEISRDTRGEYFLPGMFTHGTFDYPVYAECTNWADADITEFTFEIRYQAGWLRLAEDGEFDGILNKNVVKIRKGDIIPGDWGPVTATEVDDNANPGWKKCIISCSGTTPISANGSLVLPTFQALLNDTHTFNPEINDENTTFGGRDNCVFNESVPGTIVFENCVQELRNIVSSGVDFNINEIAPNPVSNGSFDLEFSVGFDIQTRIDILNSNGELAAVVLDNRMNTGNYQAKVSTKDLSSGVYFIRMKSGPYEETRKLVIGQ